MRCQVSINGVGTTNLKNRFVCGVRASLQGDGSRGARVTHGSRESINGVLKTITQLQEPPCLRRRSQPRWVTAVPRGQCRGYNKVWRDKQNNVTQKERTARSRNVQAAPTTVDFAISPQVRAYPMHGLPVKQAGVYTLYAY